MIQCSCECYKYMGDVTGHPLLRKVCSFVANLADLAIAFGAAVVLIRVRSVDRFESVTVLCALPSQYECGVCVCARVSYFRATDALATAK